MTGKKAKGRMINRCISTSRKLYEVDDRSALIYTWLIPHTDAFGRMEGEAIIVMGSVVPLRGYTPEQVEESLQALEQAKLIERYEVDGKQYLEIVGFEENQAFRTDRKRVGHYPAKKGCKQTVSKSKTYQRHTKDIPEAVTGKKPSPQVKLKVKGLKVKDKGVKKTPTPKKSFGEFKNVKLTLIEKEKLDKRYGSVVTREYITKLGLYLESKGKRYKSHYATILAWAKKDRVVEEVATAPPPKPEPKLTPEQEKANKKKIDKIKNEITGKLKMKKD